MREGFKTAGTGSLQVQDIENEEVILSLHHAEHPIQSSIRLEGEIHRNHPTMTLQGNGEQEGSTVAWGSSATSNLSSADISFKRFVDLVRSEIVNALITGPSFSRTTARANPFFRFYRIPAFSTALLLGMWVFVAFGRGLGSVEKG